MLVNHTALAAPGEVSGIALPFGVCASVAIPALQAGLRHGGIAASWLAIDLLLGVPTAAPIPIVPGGARLEARHRAVADPALDGSALERQAGSGEIPWLMRPCRRSNIGTPAPGCA
jgi:hypothetical protein